MESAQLKLKTISDQLHRRLPIYVIGAWLRTLPSRPAIFKGPTPTVRYTLTSDNLRVRTDDHDIIVTIDPNDDIRIVVSSVAGDTLTTISDNTYKVLSQAVDDLASAIDQYVL